MSIRSAMSVIARTTSGAGLNSSWDANLAARIIRSGSSLNETSGADGVLMTLSARSSSPPNGLANSPVTADNAIELMVKSRRDRSPSSVSPNATSGLRDDGS